jgi:prolyl oligopeptidase
MTEGEETMLWHQRDGVPDIRPGLVRKSVYRSKDGTKVPISIVEPESSAVQLPDGPAVMTGYGGFGTPMTPRYSVLVAVMVTLGTIFLLPHIRGGGEFGKEWHDSARRRRRQVAFDDFIAAAEWAYSQHLTTPKRLAIFGGSNSGLLVGVAVTQRPDLFRAALCIAPLLDMVRYETLDQSPRWEQEYGTVADPQDFTAIYAYSPYHHVRQDTNYPAMMFVSGDKDERCSPAHVRKMAARLQEGEAQSFPVIVDYSEERGHSPALPLEVRIDSLARRIAFLCKELDIPPSVWRAG